MQDALPFGISEITTRHWSFEQDDAAQFPVDCGIKGAGIDAVSMGDYNDPKTAGSPHHILLGNGNFLIEELYFPDDVMDGRRRLFVEAPVKLQGFSGAWTRAALWEY